MKYIFKAISLLRFIVSSIGGKFFFITKNLVPELPLLANGQLALGLA